MFRKINVLEYGPNAYPASVAACLFPNYRTITQNLYFEWHRLGTRVFYPCTYCGNNNHPPARRKISFLIKIKV